LFDLKNDDDKESSQSEDKGDKDKGVAEMF